eukprot:TRINITY_DN1983_c0_g1_i2.p1 TRINITY_DN1983_c0_g1~~TRINITY_DN1983_c0_g1_i2.p1  ORF type:complete len:174 (+),score=25.07 TRINITY_DN1983_c0_g1_i2:101-622(+)
MATTRHTTSNTTNNVSKSSLTKRLQSELMSLMMSSSPSSDVTAFPDGDNLLRWIGTIKGAPDTAYDGLTFKLSIEFPPNYPYKAPNVKFETACFHPNVDPSGVICLDILKDKWSAVYNIKAVLLSIQSLLGEPNNESPLNAQAAELWSNQVEFKKVLLKNYNSHLAPKSPSKN